MRVTYNADTEGGSSGAPIAGASGHIVAIHRGGDQTGGIGILLHAILTDALHKDPFIAPLLLDGSSLRFSKHCLIYMFFSVSYFLTL